MSRTSTAEPGADVGKAPGPWPAAWARAMLPTAILACLRAEPLHGYAIAQALARRGFGTPRGGSLYPVLARLEEAGAVTARWGEGAGGPGRKTYALTETGRERLAEEIGLLTGLAESLRDHDAAHPAAADRLASQTASEGEIS